MVIGQSNYNIAIVADGNTSIGMGHIMRCSAIADALNDMGGAVFFIISDHNSEEQLHYLGYDAICMNTDYRELSNQGEKIIEYLHKYRVRFVFFDSYFASNDLFESVSEVCPVGCFGYGKNYYRGMRLIVPYGVSSDRQWYEECFLPENTKVLFGPKYVPLKRSYWDCSDKDGYSEPKRLLLTSGGTDSLGITMALIKEIRSQEIDIAIDVVVGRYYDASALRAFCTNIERINLHEELLDLSSLMSTADIAVSAGGMTLYELMASSVPTIAYALADNQLGNSLLDGGVVWCGDVRRNGILDETQIKNIVLILKDLLHKPKKRLALIKKGKLMCDGYGAKRIAQNIGELIIGGNVGVKKFEQGKKSLN